MTDQTKSKPSCERDCRCGPSCACSQTVAPASCGANCRCGAQCACTPQENCQGR
jgi:hypothetical protein